VFICAKEFISNLEHIATPWIHYGWWHWACWEQNPGKFQGFGKAILKRSRNSLKEIDVNVCLPSIDEQLIIIGGNLTDLIIDPSRKHCIPRQCNGSKYAVGRSNCKDPDHCISSKNNWDTNYAGTSLIHWIKDLAADKVDIYVDNDSILHYPATWGYGRKGKPQFGQKLCDTFYVTHPNKDPRAIYDQYINNRYFNDN